MLLIQKYLLSHSFSDLQKEHGVLTRISSRTPYKFCLNYDQFSAKNDDLLAQECRGLIIRPVLFNENWETSIVGEVDLLCFPMKRFFNYEQQPLVQINWEDPEIRYFEKCDGTMISLSWDPLWSEWCVATRGISEANIPINQEKLDFSQLFDVCLQTLFSQTREQFTQKLDRRKNYIFELISPFNKIYVDYHNQFQLKLLAIRNLDTLQEENLEGQLPLVERPKEFYFLNDQNIFDYVNSRNGKEFEGLIAVDSQFNRVKIKNIHYINGSKIKDTEKNSPREFLKFCLTYDENHSIVQDLDSEIKVKFFETRKKLIQYGNLIDYTFHDFLNQSSNRKCFAELVKTSNFNSQILFKLWDKPIDGFNFLQEKVNDKKTSNQFWDDIVNVIQTS